MPKQPGWLGLKEYGDAVLRSFVVPFGAVFIERCLNTGVFKDSDVPYWWAITVVSFLLGRMLGGLLPVRSQQGPYRRRARHFLLSFLALTALVVGMGYVRKLQGLVILRFFTGLVASLMWSQEEANWNQSAGGRGAAAQEKGGVLLSPATCLGCLVGGVIGGFFFPTGTRVVVQPRPSLLPSVLASLAITLPALVALTMALGKRRPMHQRHARSKPAASNTPTPPRHHHMASTLSSSSYRSDDGGSLSPMRGGYGGGSGADVESGGGMGQSIPVNFLRSCNNDRARAWARYQKTLEWRRAHRVDSILTRPHPHFDVIKRYYPHYIHCRSLADELVIYEFPGRMDISKLKASGVSPVEMGQHYAFFMEFLFSHLDPRDEARIMTVLDIGGISLSMLSSDVLEVLRTTSEIMQSHYPERVVRIVVVNVPFFLGSAWKVIASVLPKSVQDRIELSSDAPKDLRKYISPANLPQAYGGENRQDFGHSPEETELRRVVDRANGSSTSQGGGGGGAMSSSSSQPPAPRAYIGASPPPFTVRPTRVATTISTPVTIAHRPPPPPPPPEPASEPPRPPSISAARTTTTTSTTTTTTATASSSSSQSSSPAQGGGGGGGWKIFRSPFSSAKPKQAFLGYENRYVFDRERQMWVLEDELAPLQQQQQPQPPPQPQQPTQAPQPHHPSTHYQASSSSHEAPLARPSSPAPPLSDDDAASVEEHGLVLAIQAAHYAERFQRQQQHDHADPRLLGSFGDRQRTLMLNQRGGGAVGSTTIDVAGQYHHPSSSSEDQQQYRPPPPSCFLVLQSVCLLVCWSALHVSLEAMVPLWLLTPWHAGGVGLSTRTVGVLACLTALLLLAFAMLGPRSLRNLPWTSPLRAFRLSSCLLVLTCLSVIFRPSLPGLLHLTTPFVTVHYLLLLSSLTFSLALGRHASVTLCHMVLKHTVSNPGHVVKSAAAAGQVAGPFVAAFILSWSLQAGLPYPMDSRLIFHAAAILSLALYVLSLTLHINVVGDFGVSGEDDDDAIFGHALASRIWRYIGDAFGLSSYRDFSRVLDDRMQTPRQYHYHHKPK